MWCLALVIQTQVKFPTSFRQLPPQHEAYRAWANMSIIHLNCCHLKRVWFFRYNIAISAFRQKYLHLYIFSRDINPRLLLKNIEILFFRCPLNPCPEREVPYKTNGVHSVCSHWGLKWVTLQIMSIDRLRKSTGGNINNYFNHLYYKIK